MFFRLSKGVIMSLCLSYAALTQAFVTTGNLTVHHASTDSYKLPTTRAGGANLYFLGVLNGSSSTDPAELGWITASPALVYLTEVSIPNPTSTDEALQPVSFESLGFGAGNAVKCTDNVLSNCTISRDVDLKICLQASYTQTDDNVVGNASAAILTVGSTNYTLYENSVPTYTENQGDVVRPVHFITCHIVVAKAGDTMALQGRLLSDSLEVNAPAATTYSSYLSIEEF